MRPLHLSPDSSKFYDAVYISVYVTLLVGILSKNDLKIIKK